MKNSKILKFLELFTEVGHEAMLCRCAGAIDALNVETQVQSDGSGFGRIDVIKDGDTRHWITRWTSGEGPAEADYMDERLNLLNFMSLEAGKVIEDADYKTSLVRQLCNSAITERRHG